MGEEIDVTYALTSNKRREDFRGIGLIIVNIFGDSTKPERLGAEEELQMLTELFESFNLEVKPHTELTKDEIVKVLEETAKDPKMSSDSMIAIAISSHGCEEGLLGIHKGDRLRRIHDPDCNDNMEDCIPPTQIQDIFNGNNCKSLAGKPKLFLFNGCRGKGIEIIIPTELNKLPAAEETVHNTANTSLAADQSDLNANVKFATTWSDFFVIHSCVLGNSSVRSENRGSLFFVQFCEAYAKYGGKYPIEDIMPLVNRNLIIFCKKNKKAISKQSCTWVSTCTRSFLIHPIDDSGRVFAESRESI